MLERSQAWRGAAIAAGNLGDLHATIGDLARALRYAEDAVRLAKKSEVDIELGIRTGRLGGVLHEHWRLDEAEAAFNEAEKVQRDYNPEHPLLYSYLGFQYCDLLLTRGECEAVLERATQTLLLATEHGGPLDIAFDNLSLGRAHMMKEQTEGGGDFSQAAHHLEQAVQGLRDTGQRDQIPRGLLARAELRRVTPDFDGARRDLTEVMTIAKPGGMRLFEADCHLGYARLELAEKDHKKARGHLGRAKAMIEDMGYHRRDPEVAELERLIDRRPS